MVIICASACEKLTKNKIGVKLKSIQILLKVTSIVPKKSHLFIICTNSCDNMHGSGDTPITQLPRFDLLKDNQGQSHEVY